MSEMKKIATVSFQSSVVVKGIEKKLSEWGYQVTSVIEKFDEIKSLAREMELFIVYLPGDIMGDSVRKSHLSKICEELTKRQKNAILIGEMNFHKELLQEIPEAAEFEWLNRPIDMELLGKTVEKAIERSTAPEAAEGEKKRILIVDDDPSYAKMVREWLKDAYQVGIVTAGMQAITFLLKNKVDLILLDYEMPVVDGPQVLQMLRSEPSTKDIPIVFLTGVGTREGVERVMALNPRGYILKSTTREDLRGYLKRMLGNG